MSSSHTRVINAKLAVINEICTEVLLGNRGVGCLLDWSHQSGPF